MTILHGDERILETEIRSERACGRWDKERDQGHRIVEVESQKATLTWRVIVLHHGTSMHELEGARGKLCIVRELLADNSELRVRWWEREMQPVRSISNML